MSIMMEIIFFLQEINIEAYLVRKYIITRLFITTIQL
jgi:hypothetical protein